VVLVKSNPPIRASRTAVRNSWGKRMWDLGAPVIFSVGRLYSEKEDKEILDEAREINDILVWDFLDTYANLTLKSILNVLWVAQHCPRVKASFYTDVDIVVLPDRLINFLRDELDVKFYCWILH